MNKWDEEAELEKRGVRTLLDEQAAKIASLEAELATEQALSESRAVQGVTFRDRAKRVEAELAALIAAKEKAEAERDAALRERDEAYRLYMRGAEPAPAETRKIREALYWLDRAFQHTCAAVNCVKCRAKSEAASALSVEAPGVKEEAAPNDDPSFDLSGAGGER